MHPILFDYSVTFDTMDYFFKLFPLLSFITTYLPKATTPLTSYISCYNSIDYLFSCYTPPPVAISHLLLFLYFLFTKWPHLLNWLLK